MNAQQLNAYRRMPVDAKAAYLVRIGEARDISDAFRQMAARRNKKQRTGWSAFANTAAATLRLPYADN